jgi:hypothetical protein
VSEEARRTLRYVEPLNDARTPLAGFFSILLVDAAARFDPSKHPVDQSGDAKLGSDKSFDRGYLADIHPQDTGPIGQGCNKMQRIIPPKPPWLGRAERRD